MSSHPYGRRFQYQRLYLDLFHYLKTMLCLTLTRWFQRDGHPICKTFESASPRFGSTFGRFCWRLEHLLRIELCNSCFFQTSTTELNIDRYKPTDQINQRHYRCHLMFILICVLVTLMYFAQNNRKYNYNGCNDKRKYQPYLNTN